MSFSIIAESNLVCRKKKVKGFIQILLLHLMILDFLFTLFAVSGKAKILLVAPKNGGLGSGDGFP